MENNEVEFNWPDFLLALLITFGLLFATYFLYEYENAQRAAGAEVEQFIVYGAGNSIDQPRAKHFIDLGSDLSLLRKLDLLAGHLSVLEFSGLPIEIQKIEKVDGNNIALVNLREYHRDRNNSDAASSRQQATWRSHYFRDTSDGFLTSSILKATLLQKDYSGHWIDGVKFYYENRPIGQGDSDHTYLDSVFYR